MSQKLFAVIYLELEAFFLMRNVRWSEYMFIRMAFMIDTK